MVAADAAAHYAVTLYRARKGDPVAQREIGEAHWFGRGVAQDFAQGVEWYRRAADKGDVTAQKALGRAYWLGRGVPQDNAEAFRWQLRAAEQGDASAQFAVGTFHAEGHEVPQNEAHAAVWYRRAAEQGHRNAQHQLGVAYWRGQGVPQSYIEAHMWLNLAGAQGDAEARRNRDRVAAKMTRSLIAEAQGRARRWIAVRNGRSEAQGALQGAGGQENRDDRGAPGALALIETPRHVLAGGRVQSRADGPWARAISRGALIDITAAAAEYNFCGPVAITSSAWREAVAWNRDERPPQSSPHTCHALQALRVGNVLEAACRVMLQARRAGTMRQAQHYTIPVVTPSGGPLRKQVGLKILVHRGDSAEAVGTIMLAEEEPPWLNTSHVRAGRRAAPEGAQRSWSIPAEWTGTGSEPPRDRLREAFTRSRKS